MPVGNKPRLKVTLAGTLTVISPGTQQLSEAKVRAQLRRRYGTLQNFCLQWGLKYSACIDSFHWIAERRAGEVGRIRQILGMKSAPSAVSEKLVAAHPQRRVEAPR